MIGIIFATLEEARPFLAKLKVEPVTEEAFTLFQGKLPNFAESFFIIISGMGRMAAAAATELLIGNYCVKRIINAGICGALTDRTKAKIGMVFRIAQASVVEPGPENIGQSVDCAADMWANLPIARLVTNEHPVFDPQKREALAKVADLVDMEGAVIARICETNGIPCSMIKGVSDFADRGERQALYENLPAVSERIARLLYKEVLDNV